MLDRTAATSYRQAATAGPFQISDENRYWMDLFVFSDMLKVDREWQRLSLSESA
jgi:hypothetical protein